MPSAWTPCPAFLPMYREANTDDFVDANTVQIFYNRLLEEARQRGELLDAKTAFECAYILARKNNKEAAPR